MSKGYGTNPRAGADYFRQPAAAGQRQYEALRSYLVDGRSAHQAGQPFGYTAATVYALCRELRAGRLRWFEPAKPGPKQAPKRDAARQHVIHLRKQNHSIYDIQRMLRAEQLSLSHVLIHTILREEGFAKLPRRREDERPAVPRPEVAEVADVRQLDWKAFTDFQTEGTALFLLLPALIDWGLNRWVRRARLPGSKMIPALHSLLSLLALKLVGKERVSHVMDVCSDPGFALFAGLNVLPKTTALSTYSYRVTRAMTVVLLESYTQTLNRLKLLPGKSFNLDFHAIPQRGDQALLEKHYVSKRSRRERAILAFLVQDEDAQMLCYANALYRQLARRLAGFETAKPKQIFRRFLNTPARVRVTDTEVRVRIRRCAHHPLLLASGALDPTPAIPWWQGRRLHLEIR